MPNVVLFKLSFKRYSKILKFAYILKKGCGKTT